MQKSPRGGTELQLEYLNKYVSKDILDQVQITTSVPEKIPLHPTKMNILWQKNSYDQPNLAPWFKDKSNHNKYDWYVFNSHWNYEKFRMMFDVPTEKCLVIKNGVDNIKPRNIRQKQSTKIKLIFHPTPWRGLNIILAAMQYVKNPNIELDVYSSTEVYGEDFKKANDKHYQELYDQAKVLPNVNYIGYKPNEYIKEHLHEYDIFAYPSIWEETFCISALEAMAAGLYVITTDYGALYETCAEFSSYIPYQKNSLALAQNFAFAIETAADHLYDYTVCEHLDIQIKYVNEYYNWKKQANAWTNFLKGALNARSK
jgi:glycosyltransferase involved in cell wall biosynthesis